MKKKTKAQIQMSENVIILFLFFILLAFGAVFYTRIQGAKVQEQQAEIVQGQALQIAQSVAFLPEVQCSIDGAQIPDCYDEYNMFALNSLAQKGENRDYYFPLFGSSIIYVDSIFPDMQHIVLYNHSKANYTSINPAHIPITMCNFTATTSEDDCSFSVLTVEVYN